MTHWTASPGADYDADENPAVAAARTGPTSTIRGALTAGFAVVFVLWGALRLRAGAQPARSRAPRRRRAATISSAEPGCARHRPNQRPARIDLPSRRADRTHARQLRGLPRRAPEDSRRRRPRAVRSTCRSVESPIERQHWDDLQVELERTTGNRATWCSSPRGRSRPRMPPRCFVGASCRRASRSSRSSIRCRRSSALRASATRRRRRSSTATHATRVLSLASLAIVVGLVVAVVATRHVGRLEHEIERRQAAERQNRRDLERLSARLVTAQEEERRSLARELHDAVGQALTAIKMEMGVAMRGVETDSRARTGARRGARDRRVDAAERPRPVAVAAPVDARRLRAARSGERAPAQLLEAHRHPHAAHPRADGRSAAARRSRSASTASSRRR